MGRDLSVALIGCGRMGANTPASMQAALPPGWWPLNHADAVAAVPGLRLVGCCDTNEVAAAATAAKHDSEPFSDYRAMVAKHRPDIVAVATRAKGRAEMLCVLASMGVRGIHAEKPLCWNLQEGEAAAEALRRHNVAFSYGATRRYMHSYREAHARVGSGAFGKAQQINLHFGPAALLWTHPHVVDLAMFFGDNEMPVKAQAAFIDPVAADGDVLDADPRLAFGFLSFASGFSALISATPGCDIAVGCEQGVVSVLNDGLSIDLRSAPADGASRYLRDIQSIAVTDSPSGIVVALTELRDTLNGSGRPSSGIEQALNGQRALLALAMSGLRGGEEVRLADVPCHFTVTGRLGDLYA